MITTIKNKAIFLAFTLVPSQAFSQSTAQNYVMEKTMLDAEGTHTVRSVQYYNGLGYPTVSVGNTGDNGSTAYTLTTYDGAGREERRYVPVSTDKSVNYKAPGTINGLYGDAAPYSQTLYDALDRPVSVTTAGSAFAGSPATTAYVANKADEVIHYGVDVNGNLTQDGYYPANSLRKEVHTDPDKKKTETFKDFSGRVVMQRCGGSLCTYYVYNDLDQLCFVLPPKYQSDGDLAATGYEYRYDGRGRLKYKILPGTGYVEYWYDNADRMICMQDAVMRTANKYRFFLYDRFSHLVLQGLCTACQRGSDVQNAEFGTSAGVLGTGYVMPKAFTTALKDAELETANYYDGNQGRIKGKMNSCFSDLTLPTTEVSQTGQLTGVITAATNGKLPSQAMQYDIKGNVTSSKAKDIGSRTISITSTYTHTDNLSHSVSTVSVGYGGSMTVTEGIGYNTYNGQMSSDTLKVSHGTAATAVVGYGHDNLGKLSKVTRPTSSSTNRSVSYGYDLRGWLTNITATTFTEELFYADGPGTKCCNGNISSIRWKDGTSGTKRGYRFTYDAANRLTSGAYGEGDALTANTGRYSESMKYDANGNITALTRYGKTSSGYGVMDKLTVSYTGNRPTKVSESVSDNNLSGSFEYKKAKGSGYKFNENGSLVADKSRGIAYITYDFNNNPRQIYFTNGSVTKYVYSASGRKLRVVHYTAKPNITRTWGKKPAELTLAQILQADSVDYLLDGRIMMKNGRIDKYLFEGGYAQASVAGSTTDNFAFYYYNRDHLGSIREVVDASGKVKQVTNYYPFGAPYADTSSSTNPDFQPYKYNGKELDRMHGLDTYDYGARQHDPILARWDRMDPLCEKYYGTSPYVYCKDNPVKNIDPDGKIIVIARGASESFIRDYEQTVQTIEEKGCGDVWKALNDSPEVYTLVESSSNSNSFDSSTKTISWNSRKGLYTSNDVYLSPATRLNHELSHALQFDKNPEQYKKDMNTRIEGEDETYTVEERRVIEGTESKTAACLGEIKSGEKTRFDHSGRPFDTNSPISNRELEPMDVIVFPK